MRSCGILLPVSSLPSPYGIGGFSKEAYKWIDSLKEAGQKYWQILPLGPTGYGDSPYQAFSAFAGNPYFIDLEELIRDGYLTRAECEESCPDGGERYIEYGQLYEKRFPLLKKAYRRWMDKQLGGSAQRVHELAAGRLGDETREYCIYMAVKDHFGSKSWNLWDEDIRLRRPEAVERYRELLTEEIGFYEFQQILFEEQWSRLKEYANRKGIRLIGDIPIYVAFDGADSWFHPELFQFDEENLPEAVAGCPPDAFSRTGQLWGNPLYRWEYHKKTGYRWWIRRMEYSFRLYDMVRIDHFRGFDAYYSIPYGAKTAEFGHWEQGPGIELFDRMKQAFGGKKLPVIAEDLGFLTPSVHKLLKATAFPGMKVLEFAFDPSGESDYLPHRYGKNCVVYTGTHDNDTLAGWYGSMSRKERAFAREYMGCQHTPKQEMPGEFIRLALASAAKLAVIPAQDYLGLGSEARINTPSTLGDNWRWRLLPEEFSPEVILKCRRMAELYGR